MDNFLEQITSYLNGDVIHVIISYLEINDLMKLSQDCDFHGVDWNMVCLHRFGKFHNMGFTQYIGYLRNLDSIVFIEKIKMVSTINDVLNTDILLLNNKSIVNIPIEIRALHNIKHLNLMTNNIIKIPGELGALVNLKELCLSNNQITQVPPEIGNLTNLISINLNNNHITKIPLELSNLKKLEYLYLNNNKLTKIINGTIGKLIRLEMLDLSNNLIEKLPRDLGNLSRLGILTLYGNRLKEIPMSLTKLSNLYSIDLRENLMKINKILVLK